MHTFLKCYLREGDKQKESGTSQWTCVMVLSPSGDETPHKHLLNSVSLPLSLHWNGEENKNKTCMLRLKKFSN